MEKRFITPKEAISLLNAGEEIHTYRNPNGMLIGVCYNRSDLIDKLESNPRKIQIGGELCRQMNHGIVLEDNGNLFIETNKEKLNAFDPI